MTERRNGVFRLSCAAAYMPLFFAARDSGNGIDGLAAILLLISVVVFLFSIKILFSVPGVRRKEQIKIEEKKCKAEALMKTAEQSIKEADYKWSLRAAAIENEVSQKFNKKVADAVKDKELQIKNREQKVETERKEVRDFIMSIRGASPAWIARAITDYEYLRYDTELNWSCYSTVRDYISSLRSANRERRREMYLAMYKCLYYESLFPGLLDYADDEVPNAATSPVPEKTTEKDWLSDEEYARLSSTEKSQLALDRYIGSHNKSKWQIGRDYELYIGHCYRRKDFQVEHIGMEKKLADMGRDLICRSDPLSSSPETHIVQCKYWSKEKLIHEKHVMQLFGTTVEYAFAHGIELTNGRLPARLKPVLITSTRLSDMARHFAVALGVQYHENIGLPEDVASFPRIKCNKSSGIFHLPFDEQYDVTKIVPSEGDCFCVTVAEAESKGFRRARRFYTLPRSSQSVPPT
ncbi:MAG: hypothetical protein IKL96_02570 [Kiritimatiellae bacterium]|nr:hypothetical protein [Kiritimatiellia bacterium]